MVAKDVMSDGVMSVAADATILEAAKVLVNAEVSAMPVVDSKGVMIGIVSEADLIDRGAARDSSEQTGLLHQFADDMASAGAFVRANARLVTDVMTRHVVSVEEDTTLGDIAELMLDRGVKRVPVRRGHSVVGMVSRIDLVRALISQRAAASATPTSAAALPERNDDKLRRDIESAVRGRSWSLARRSDVVVQDGIAHLWGVVPSDMVRQAYCVAAENVPGVKSVQSHMHVVPPSPVLLGL
jgi:CBS-domain-containing membrane protein